jgi:hypothetical protein
MKVHTENISMSAQSELLRTLLDRQEIQDTIARYALGQDSHQDADSAVLQQWDEVFTEDGTVDYSAASAPLGSYRDLAKWMRGAQSTPGRMSSFSHWQHMLSLPLVTIQGDTATARTDFFSTHRGRPEQGLNVHYNSPGAFHDQLVRTPKGWRIRFRRLEVYFGDALQIASPT